MAKDKISDYSSTANSNTDIAGINIDEGCAPSGINDAIRTLMAQLKTWQSGGQDVYIHPAGTASAPSITANGDTNTGIFFPAADTVGISTGGTERARVDSSGNLGLGVTPVNAYTGLSYKNIELPSAAFYSFALSSSRPIMGLKSNAYYDSSANTKYIGNGYATNYVTDAGAHAWYTAPNNSSGAGAALTFTQAMTLDASGNLGVGTTSPAMGLHVVKNWTSGKSTIGAQSVTAFSSGGLAGFGMFDSDGTRKAYIAAESTGFGIEAAAGTPIIFTINTERARIDSSGRLLVGTTSAFNSAYTMSLAVSGSTGGLAIKPGADGYTAAIFFNAAGTNTGTISVSSSTTTYNTSSDYRLKNSVVPMTGALAKVALLKPCTYRWNADNSEGEGFIAHELAEVCPHAVTGEKDAVDADGNPVYQGIDTSFLVATLTAALQEMKAIIDDQAARIAALEAK